MNQCPQCRYQGEEATCPKDGTPMVEASRFARDEEAQAFIGKTFAERYQVESVIGRGGMGWVFRARHVLMGHPVALKVLIRSVAQDPTAVERFFREARNTSQLTQPHTIKVHDFGTSVDGYLFLAMEFLRGHTLKEEIQKVGALPPARTVRILQRICKSLHEAHEKGMVHRDLKPENIFLAEVPGETDWVKVLDFGIAKSIEQQSGGQDLTRAGYVVGTPKYMPPEQAKGLAVDRRADLYSLGIVAYEMLTGDAPFTGPSSMSILMKQATEPAPDVPAEIQGNAIPPALRVLVATLLHKRPDDRPSTADAVARQLDSLAEEAQAAADAAAAPPTAERRALPSAADSAPVAAADAAAVPGATTGTRSGVRPQAAPSRRWLPLLIVGLVVAAGASVATVLLTRGSAPVGLTGAGLRLNLDVTAPGPNRPAADAAVAAADARAAVPPGDVAAPPPAADAAAAPRPAADVAAPPPAADAAAAPRPADTRAPTPDQQAPPPAEGVVVRLVTEPPGADVVAGREVLGRTPFDLRIAKGETRKLEFRLTGYRKQRRTVRANDAPELRLQLRKPSENVRIQIL